MTSHEWGRVAEDGTVFVRTAEGERPVGQYPVGSPEEALGFFTERFDALAFEVDLLEKRVRTGALSPEDAATSIKAVTEQVTGANAVGDLGGLVARLESLGPVLAEQRAARKAEKAQRVEQARAQKETIVAEAEKLAQGADWRNGANRLRELLEEWKGLARLDRAADDALWRRFSTARTTYTRRRKTHFAEQHEKRDAAAVVKQKLVKEAEALAGSKEWGVTAGKYRDLMKQWKAAGPAPREVEESLWQRFRAAQDAFFGARDVAVAAEDAVFAANAEVKERLLEQAEALLPVQDLDQAKKALREISEKWEAAGKVPRDRMKELEGRLHKVEREVRGLEEDQWRRSDPEKSARADDMVSKLQAAISKVEAELERAKAAQNAALVSQLEDNLASRREFLETAKRASSEFSG